MHSVECTPGGSRLLCPCIAVVNGKEDVTALSDRDGALAAWPWISLNTECLAKRAITAGPSTGLAGLGCSPLAAETKKQQR